MDGMSYEEFEQFVVRPIRAAYRCPSFLFGAVEGEYFDVWYSALKEYDTERVSGIVQSYIKKHTELPVLAHITRDLEWEMNRG